MLRAMDDNPKPRRLGAPALVFLLFIAMFGVIGAGLLIHLWGPGDGFHQPPLIFRFVGSAIAGMFMLIGFGVPISAILRHRQGGPSLDVPVPPRDTASSVPPPPSTSVGYRCPHCGAGLGSGQEVSPSGDAKCGYCHRWWNIHRESR